MNEENRKNHHLNLFHFYGKSKKQFLEDNLTRGLAICLENDPILLDRFLRAILKENFDNLFRTVGGSDNLMINVQERAKDFEGVQTVFGVPLTTRELSGFEDSEPQGVDNPITDLSIQINDNLILVEVKRTKEDCRSQLQNQVEKMNETIDGDLVITYEEEFKWGTLMDLYRHTLNFQREVKSVNLFTYDYYHFVKRQYPAWFENVPFGEISFPSNIKDNPKLKELIEVRLNVIKEKMLEIWNKERGRKDDLVYNRANIPVPDYNWVDEINIEPIVDDGHKYIAVKVWPGDTKHQGSSIYQSDKTFDWPKKISGYEFVVQPYLKFSGRGGLCWIHTKQISDVDTHKRSFFKKYTGRWTRKNNDSIWEKKNADWIDFDKILNKVNGVEKTWQKESEFDEKIQNSNRTVFNVSTGFEIEVRIPYSNAQEIDGHQSDPTPMAQELKTVSEELLQELSRQFSE